MERGKRNPGRPRPAGDPDMNKPQIIGQKERAKIGRDMADLFESWLSGSKVFDSMTGQQAAAHIIKTIRHAADIMDPPRKIITPEGAEVNLYGKK